MRIKESRRPTDPDGKKQPFNCCSSPDVVEDLDSGRSHCRSCGYDWTETLG